ncbi:MAG: histidine kinase [Saprospiraceae bacterium]
MQTLFASTDNRLWIGTKGGLFRLEEKPAEISSPVRIAPAYDWNVTDIVEDQFKNLWIGTLDKGLYIYSPATGKVKYIGQSIPIVANTIMSMAVTKKLIWISTLEGVLYYPTEKNILNEKNIEFNLISDPWKSSLHFVFQVFVDSKDRAWFATDGNGVYSIEGAKVSQHKGTDSIELKTVYSVCEDHRGHLWFNTLDYGLVEYDGYNYIPLSLAEGLGNTTISSIASAGTGDLVVVHKRGVDLMEPDRRHFMYYNDEIGIKEIDAHQNTIATDSRGHVYMSGKNLLIKHYASGHELSIHPRTQITRVAVFGETIDVTKENEFDYDENYFNFQYVGLWYTSPHSVNYQYKLEGFDIEWKESKDNVASYSSLPAGTYTFSVMASENKFFLDEPIASYSFTIDKPFWIKIWFVVIVILFGSALLYWLIKSRERRFKKQTQIKRELIESQLQAIKAQINPHFLFNSFNTLITIIDENTGSSTVAIEYVEKLSDYFRSILQYREAESITLEEEWELVQTFGYLLQKRYGPNLRLHMDPPQKDAYIFPLTLQMLVENAVKHNVIAKHKPLDVFITIEEGYIVVKNNLQPKVKSEPSTQFGLHSIVKRYQLLTDKKVLIHKDNNSFRVSIPIINRSEE